ncbi:MAG: DUF1207 domain-containing protein [Bdellovibrionaceae bacterium]|nr:DUF1207 domain-containing protein [Bdellovibrionales bacterium]MCB9255235.1 DUF1207 domain-containing protein [Pseudobdellovibrionaceae bacterium]
MRFKTLILVIGFFCFCVRLNAMQLEFLPQSRFFPLTFADPREIRMALLFDQQNRVNAYVGNYFSLISGTGAEEDSLAWVFGLEGAGYFAMRQSGATFPLEHTDGLIGVYAEVTQGPWRGQLRFTHVSAHLSDGISGTTPITYSREFLVGRLGFAPDKLKFAYLGAIVNVNSIPSLPAWSFQLGGHWFSSWNFARLTPFVAMDIKWRQESSQNPSLSAQFGLALNNPPEAYRSFRLFYNFYTGADSRGQFYSLRYTSHALGIEMQI